MFHILVIDDDKNPRRLMRAVLEGDGYTVFTAADGQVNPYAALQRKCKAYLTFSEKRDILLNVKEPLLLKGEAYEKPY